MDRGHLQQGSRNSTLNYIRNDSSDKIVVVTGPYDNLNFLDIPPIGYRVWGGPGL